MRVEKWCPIKYHIVMVKEITASGFQASEERGRFTEWRRNRRSRRIAKRAWRHFLEGRECLEGTDSGEVMVRRFEPVPGTILHLVAKFQDRWLDSWLVTGEESDDQIDLFHAVRHQSPGGRHADFIDRSLQGADYQLTRLSPVARGTSFPLVEAWSRLFGLGEEVGDQIETTVLEIITPVGY